MKRICWIIVALLVLDASALGETLYLPDSLTAIEEEAFYGDKRLDTVVLPDGVTRIGARAFGNSGLKEIHLPGSVREIANSAFKKSPEVTAISP